jgi:cobalamin synthase
MQWQYSDYMNGFVAPFVFTFALVSAALSAMQVVLAAQPPSGNQTHGWREFTSVSQWSAVVFLILIAICAVFFPFIICILLFRELVYAIRSKLRRRRNVGGEPSIDPGLQSEHHQSKVN